jgi:predicted CoA-binding protein
MAKISKTAAEQFLAPKKFALVGLSRDPKKFSRAVYKELFAKGFEIYPVNPAMDDLDGRKVFHSLADVPQGIAHALIMTPKKETASAVYDAARKGMTHIWIQQGAETPEALDEAKKHGLNVVSKACILMHAPPVRSVHAFHRFMAKLFGQISA